MRFVILIVACLALLAPPVPARTFAEAPGPADDDWTAVSADYVPEDHRRAPFLGNGAFGTVVPPTGAGYQDYGPDNLTSWPLQQPRYTGTFAAGFYARTGDGPTFDQTIAALPAWTGLTVSAGEHTYAPGVDPATLSGYRQRLDFRTATVTTATTWTPAPGYRVDLVYETFLSRSRPNLGIQRLTLTPHFTGTVVVTDLLDGAAARRVTPLVAETDPARYRTTVGVGAAGDTGTAFEVSTLVTPSRTPAEPVPASGATAGLRVAEPVTAGDGYTFTKYVGLSSTADAADPATVARSASADGLAAGFDALHGEHTGEWHRLWEPAIEIPGHPDYRAWIRSALYSVLSSVRAGQRWSIPPAGLSSDDYAGMIFWDADTWIFPALLALHPELARTVVEMRVAALPQALANARSFGMPGAVYPWNNGPDQHCPTPLKCGLDQTHLQNEIALAQWFYYLATGDRDWLRTAGAPVIMAIADYLVARVGPKLPDGKYHFAPASAADEYAVATVDHTLTNIGVANTMRLARTAAELTGRPVDTRWDDIAGNMALPGHIAPGVPAEYRGYAGQQIKQADVALISYPYTYSAPDYSPSATMHYYFPRTDPDGPNMSSSVGAILAAEHDPCATRRYLDRAVAPYSQGPFGFQTESPGETAGQGAGQPAWIFLTGAAGFLHALLYGPTGLRWTATGPRLDPMLPTGFDQGMTVRRLRIGASTVTVDIRPEHTRVHLLAGPALTFDTPEGHRTVDAASPLLLPTRAACT
ncbi:haloacid dehalogenase [Nocardia sp. NPDC019395]|uniref:haloacid dehalogenase n=1 Tax=Nocardia sp. NPDC019395 TaxID=3154686 RepID=UPI0034040E69